MALVVKKSKRLSKLFSALFRSKSKETLTPKPKVKFKDLVLDSEWDEIKKVIVQENLHQDRDLFKLKEVYEQLKTLEPMPVEPDYPWIEYYISIEWEKDLQRWESMSKELNDPITVYRLYYYDWRGVLSHYILDETLKKFTKEQIIAYTLHAITFLSYSLEEIIEKEKEL